ncbi:MAG TPA: GNAT family N-acetyltransferase [Symbiobacteriaceae bacterium]|nr:GNAT family N-acetyltransferase [Symbiobacteriaceae bacterium]
MRIRTFTPDDYPAIVALRNAENPRRPVSVAVLQEMDAVENGCTSAVWTRLVAEDPSGAVAGYAESGHFTGMAEGRFSVYTTVRRDCRGRGTGSRLLQEAEAWALARGAQSEFTARMRSDDPASFAWAERRGYVLDLDRMEAVLDLAAWDPTPFAGHVDRVRAGGLALTVTEHPTEADLQGMYAVEAATTPDIPDFEGYIPTWAEWSAEFVGSEAPWAFALALDGGRVIGWSVLSLPRAEGAGGHTHFTGVLREYRGRGLALALKLLTIDTALAHGVPFLTTTNDLENKAMLAVNARLGYRNLPGPRRIKKALP